MARHFSFEEAISQLQNDGRTSAADPAPRRPLPELSGEAVSILPAFPPRAWRSARLIPAGE